MSPRRLPFSFAIVAAVSSFGATALADAAGAAAPEQPDGCYVSAPRSPSGKLVLPASAPAIPIPDQSKNATPTLAVDPVGDVTFLSRADDRVARTLLVQPSKELPIGSLTLNWKVECSKPNRGTDVPGIAELVVTDAVPLPTSIGTVSQGLLSLSPDMLPWLAVTEIDIRLADEKNQTFTPGGYGSIARTYTKIAFGYADTATARPAETDTYFGVRGLLYEGNRGMCASRTGFVEVPITISAHVAGAASDPPAIQTTVGLDCDLARKLNEEVQTESKAATATTTASGCSASPSPRDTGPGIFAAIVAAAIALRRRTTKRGAT